MTVTELAAFIGAAAWTPSVVFILHKLFVLPKVELYADRQVQIGYTSYGPIFNLNLALSSQKKDIMINGIALTLIHEDGAKYDFFWQGLSEPLSKIHNPLGPTMSVEKTLPPIVIKVLAENFVQAFIRFMNPCFSSEFAKASSGFQDRFNFVRRKKEKLTKEDIESTIDCGEYEALIDFYKSGFHWKKGHYVVTFNLKSPRKFKFTSTHYSFNLSQQDVDDLGKNLDNIRTDFHQILMTNVEGYEWESIPWIWKNPSLVESGKSSSSSLLNEM